MTTSMNRGIRHHQAGEPADVLTFETLGLIPDPGPGEVRVRVACVAIHPGDLHMVRGTSRGGLPPLIPQDGRVPGFEGAGVIEALGSRIDPSLDLHIGDRVAFFPVQGAWAEHVVVAADAVIRIPPAVSLLVAAQMLINTITSQVVLRAVDAVFPARPAPRTFVLTAAASSVGRLIATLAIERGLLPIRLVRTAQGAAALAARTPGPPVFATDEDGWADRVAAMLPEDGASVAVDAVGGELLADLATLMADGGTIVNYASLSSAPTDVTRLAPHQLTYRGISIAVWARLPAKLRANDRAVALRLAHESRTQFDVAAVFDARDIAAAVAAAEGQGRVGNVLLKFREHLD